MLSDDRDLRVVREGPDGGRRQILMQMFTISADQSVPEGADWIAIARTPTARFAVFACVGSGRDVVVVSKDCKSFESAKLLGWNWAAERGVKLAYLTEPL
jgi:hypothetical protein